MEIERKFLITELPQNLDEYPKQRIEQAYLSTEPVVRIRRRGEEYILTYKGAGLLAREEREMSVSEAAYQRLLAKAEGDLIAKDRYYIPYGGYTIELDVFDAPLFPLVIAEVEFPTEADAEAFRRPDWFGEEVTYDPAYTNARLSAGKPGGGAIKPGRYRHFKGNEYEVLYVAAHSETLEPMVVYRALYGQRGVWVRPAAMWNEMVVRDGKSCPRFTYIGGEPEAT